LLELERRLREEKQQLERRIQALEAEIRKMKSERAAPRPRRGSGGERGTRGEPEVEASTSE
jgi:hypothetical protein